MEAVLRWHRPELRIYDAHDDDGSVKLDGISRYLGVEGVGHIKEGGKIIIPIGLEFKGGTVVTRDLDLRDAVENGVRNNFHEENRYKPPSGQTRNRKYST